MKVFLSTSANCSLQCWLIQRDSLPFLRVRKVFSTEHLSLEKENVVDETFANSLHVS